MSTVYAWKFVIPVDIWRSYNETTDYRGCSAVVLAATEEAARERLTIYAAENGLDSRWLDVADVKRILPVPGGVLSWVQL